MLANQRRESNDLLYREDGLKQAKKLCNVFKRGKTEPSIRSSRTISEEILVQICRNLCSHDRTPLIYLKFDHSQDLPLPKSKLASFWSFLANSGMKGYAKRRRRSSSSEKLSFSRSSVRKQNRKEKTNLENKYVDDSPALGGLKDIFELFLSKGLDKTALSIENDYRIHPYTCVCREPCCNCIKYSQHLHKMGLHHEKEAIKEAVEKIQKRRFPQKVNVPLKKEKSLVRSTTPPSFTSSLTEKSVQKNSDYTIGTNLFKNVFEDTYFEAVFDVVDDPPKKPPLNPCTEKTEETIIEKPSAMTFYKKAEEKKVLKCRPSLRSVRRHFKEIDPQKYESYINEISENPDECLLSFQSKKERVLRPKVVNSDQKVKPKWRI